MRPSFGVYPPVVNNNDTAAAPINATVIHPSQLAAVPLLNIQGIDERELMCAAQKVANRVTTGVLLAALIVGAAMLVRVETRYTILG